MVISAIVAPCALVARTRTVFEPSASGTSGIAEGAVGRRRDRAVVETVAIEIDFDHLVRIGQAEQIDGGLVRQAIPRRA